MKKKQAFLLLIAFVSGASIMGMEISASRLLAPYFGTSIFVWTNIIGVVMVALSLGYYFGGKLADKSPRLEVLLRLIFFSGLTFLAVPIVIKPLSQGIDFANPGLESSFIPLFISSLLFTTLLIAFPIFLLGAVSPFVIKLYLKEDGSGIGETAGRVSALATIGSILGTFLPTLVLIPWLGTRLTIDIFALSLVALGALGLKRNKRLMMLTFILALALTLFWPPGIKAGASIIYEGESAYQYISVIEDAEGTRYLSVNEGLGVQSVYNPDRVLTGYYYDYYNLLPYLLEATGSKDILILGLSGGTIANQLRYFFGNQVEIDGVEIDPEVVEVARRYFDLDKSGANVYINDGRMFLENNDKKYDLVIVDAYSQELYIPWTMTTQEFWELVKGDLKPGGMMAININALGPESRLLGAISNTVSAVFKHTYVTGIDNGGINFILTAADRPLDTAVLYAVEGEGLGELALAYGDSTALAEYDSQAMVLTDDRAPIEFMTDKMIFDYIVN